MKPSECLNESHAEEVRAKLAASTLVWGLTMAARLDQTLSLLRTTQVGPRFQSGISYGRDGMIEGHLGRTDASKQWLLQV